MSFSSQPLRIMQDTFAQDQIYHPYEEEVIKVKHHHKETESLLSPPLTPTEVHQPHPVGLSPPTVAMNQPLCWNYRPKNRKAFIGAYSRMVPNLRKNKTDLEDAPGSERMFALNVYRDLLINKKKSEQDKKGCTMLDETVVPHTKKRKLAIMSASEDVMILNQDKPMKRKRVSSVLPSGKDAALAFDSIDIDTCDQDFYPQGWVPLREALDQVPVKVCWKGAPLPIHQQPYYHDLHHVEATMSSVLRLSPVQYLRCKRTLILAARTLKIQQIPFTKSVAQKLCRVDVNKTSALWTAFGQLGWFDGDDNCLA
ncbi:hypothetical protein EDC96DRAFT_499288 [Choanephora cucurbitarum]|nr:hypothetical protein EDC96DRAFT_499288 [Choanephora cucurbitarum]